MNKSLRSKLVLSYFAIAILTALLIYLLIRLTSDQRLKALVLKQQISEVHAEVTLWYETEHSWEGFERYFMALHPPGNPTISGQEGGERPLRQPPPSTQPPSRLRGKHGILDAEKHVLIRYLNFNPGELVPEALLGKAIAVVVDGETVGWVVPDDETGISLEAEERIYLQRTNKILLIAGAIGVIGAVLTGLGFAQLLLRPIYALTKASQAMARGDLKQQVPLYSQDELGQLAASFNAMSHDVARANQQRRQLTANIAHDLSTPLQTISGYVETFIDGSLAMTPERMGVIAAELEHLRHLINDLDLLAQSDTNTLSLALEPVALDEYLPQIAAKFMPLAAAQSVTLQVKTPATPLPPVQADRARLAQVLGNVLTNALRYTPQRGTIHILTQMTATNQVQITVHDSGVGIAPEQLPFIFDRFYQVDESRSDAGKMGLGLAISKALVEAMGGKIAAESTGSNQGATFTISLPI